MGKIYKKQTKCLKCKSRNLSDGTNDFLYNPESGEEFPIQFCNDCHEEWFIKQKKETP